MSDQGHRFRGQNTLAGAPPGCARNLNFCRPSADTRFEHIDALFGDNVIDWDLIETHWPDLLRTATSISQGRLSSVTLLRFLADARLREQITAITNKAEAFHGFSAWLRFGGEATSRACRPST